MMRASVRTPVERVRVALAEAGYPDADVTDEGEGRVGILLAIDDNHLIPDQVAWQALRTAEVAGVGCWDCWQAHREGCPHG